MANYGFRDGAAAAPEARDGRRTFQTCGAASVQSDVDTLQELLDGLYALICVHFREEEDLQLPAFDAGPEVARRVLGRMGEVAGHPHAH